MHGLLCVCLLSGGVLLRPISVVRVALARWPLGPELLEPLPLSQSRAPCRAASACGTCMYGSCSLSSRAAQDGTGRLGRWVTPPLCSPTRGGPHTAAQAQVNWNLGHISPGNRFSSLQGSCCRRPGALGPVCRAPIEEHRPVGTGCEPGCGGILCYFNHHRCVKNRTIVLIL